MSTTHTGAYVTPKPWPEGAAPTPGQALQWFRICQVDEGCAALARLMEHEETAIRCWIEDHRRRIDGDQVRLYDLIRQREAVLAIRPEEHATKSRDYGRGFAEALRLVREAMTAKDDSGDAS